MSPHFNYQLKMPPNYSESCTGSGTGSCSCTSCNRSSYKRSYVSKRSAICREDCLPKCGFSNFACLGPAGACESLEYTKIFINSFPPGARGRVIRQVDRNSYEYGCNNRPCNDRCIDRPCIDKSCIDKSRSCSCLDTGSESDY